MRIDQSLRLTELLAVRNRSGQRKARTNASGIGIKLAILYVAATSVLVVPEAHAQYAEFYGYASKAYEIVLNNPSDLSRLQALIAQTKTQIIAELDAVTAAWNSSCAANAVDTFQNINALTPDNLQAFAISSDKCVTDAQAQIGAVTTKDAVNKIGFALNTVGPIAIAVNTRASFPTEALKQHIMQANRQIQIKLAPTCDVTIDNPNDLPTYSGSVHGPGACYNFTVATPPRVEVGERGGVFYLTPGPGKAFLPWPLLGKAYPDDDVLWWRGHTAYFPPVDFSTAAHQVMQGTSWEIANAALDQLEPAVAPVGPTLALTMNTNTIYKPMDVFWANDNSTSHGTLNPVPDGSNPKFSGWKGLDGAFRSVSAGANADGRVEIFGISRIGGIFHRWEQIAGDSSQWSPMAQMDGQLNSIAVARNRDGTLQVFGTNPMGNIFTRNQVLGGDKETSVRIPPLAPAIDTWTPWKPMDGALSQIAAVSDTVNIHLFGVNNAGQLYHRQQNAPNATDPTVNGAWSTWDQMQTPVPLRMVAAAIDLGGRINVFAVANDNRIFQCVKLGNVYTNWLQIPGSMHDIAATKQGGGSGMLVLVGASADGNIYRNTSYGLIDTTPSGSQPGPWNGWVALTHRRIILPTDPLILQPLLHTQ